MPTIVFSEIGVSRTRFSPNSSSRPAVTLKAPWNTPTSSPMMKTRLVGLHLLAQRLVERLAVAHHRHQSAPPSSSGSSAAGSPSASSACAAAAPALLRVAHRGVGGALLGQLVRQGARPRARARRGAARGSARPRSTSRARRRRRRTRRRRASRGRGRASRRRTSRPRPPSRWPPCRAPRRPSASSTPSSTSRLEKVAIGSRSRHSSTSSLVRYSSGSAMEWPR